MTAKKATHKWRPSKANPLFTQLDFRVRIADADLIQSAAEAVAERTGGPVSRNNFCAVAVVAAAKKELGRAV